MQRIVGVILCASLSTVAWAQQSEDADSAPSGSVAVTAPSRVWTGPTGNVLYDNGPYADSAGTGTGGADESILEDVTLGMNTLGFGHQLSAGNRVADDFTVTDPAGWQVDAITFFAYQTGSTTTSTMTAVNLRIWDGVPGGGGSVVWGDTTTNVMSATDWSNAFRVTQTTTGTANNRPIMANTVAVNTVLPPGTYWVDWQTDGSASFSGPWAPPIVILGQATTGNGMQSLDNGVTFGPVNDSGTATQQGFPFIVEGTGLGSIPTLSQWGLLIASLVMLGAGLLVMRRRGGMAA